MKTTKFKLFATMITLAAVTTATTIPAHAQRRSTQKSSETREPARNRNYKSTIEKKSTFKDYDKPSRRSVNSKLRGTRNVQQKSSSTNTRKSVSPRGGNAMHNAKSRSRQSAPRTSKSNREPGLKASTGQGRSSAKQGSSGSYKEQANSRARKSELNRSTGRKADTRQYAGAKTNGSSNRQAARRSTGTTGADSRSFYRIDKSDKRYVPNKNYRGSKNSWSGNKRSNAIYNQNSHKHYRQYNYNTHNHWNRSWERYRWNHNSWLDYYHGYHPNSYVYHKHYYHHHHYGHVIRRFDYPPLVFVHNRHNYYSYNGHFFRYRRGIGYILVDIPFGFSFEYLPHNYERVYINGYAYFRIGNLFFEWANYGFRLVHFPERYYAYNDDYCNQGYHFDDQYY